MNEWHQRKALAAEDVYMNRLNDVDKNLVYQQKEKGGISLRKLVSLERKKMASVGHLLHFDEHLPYIVYLRFSQTNGYGRPNRAYKPVEFFHLLMEGPFGEVRMIQQYIHTKGNHESIYHRLNKEIEMKKRLSKIEHIKQ